MSTHSNEETPSPLQGKRLAFFGRLASMSKRDAAQLVRRNGAIVVENPDSTANLLIVGEELPLGDGNDPEELIDAEVRQAIDSGTLEIVPETELWRRLGLVEGEADIHRLYTPAMLAELLKVPVAVIRRWHRRSLIVPVREVRRLPYFDFQEVATARRLAELLATGMSPEALEKKLAALARYVPGIKRPLAQLSVIVEGKEILLRQGDGLIEPGGQLRFDFEASDRERVVLPASPDDAIISAPRASDANYVDEAAPQGASAADLVQMAAEWEEEGHLEAAAEMYRAAMAAGGPRPEYCFQLAEVLYRAGDLSAARERYYAAIELDEDYVEARANLGCVLAELGQHDLAVAAFQGALAYHGDYADVHYHLARLLDTLGRQTEADAHWRRFLALAPDSPWAEQAHARLGQTDE